jgi:rare lipoprotein A
MYLFSPQRLGNSTRAILTVSACCVLLPYAGGAANPVAAPNGAARKPAEVGIASWHDPAAKTAAARTASDHSWSGKELVAAHKSLPLGTVVRVFNLSNGREVIVVITDRGPFRRGRIIDVSRSAAQKLGLIQSGTARVRVETVKGGVS